jgi:hypothetical protein
MRFKHKRPASILQKQMTTNSGSGEQAANAINEEVMFTPIEQESAFNILIGKAKSPHANCRCLSSLLTAGNNVIKIVTQRDIHQHVTTFK